MPQEVLDLDVEQVRALLDVGFGVTARDVTRVSGEAATVCRVGTDAGPYAVKVHLALPGAAALLRWQDTAAHAMRDDGIPVPVPRPDRSGDTVHETVVDGVPVLAQVTPWLGDPPLGAVDVDPALCREVGRLAARVSRALRRVGPAPAPVSHPWELTRTSETLRSVLPLVADPHLREVGERVAYTMDTGLEDLLRQSEPTVLHHDLHDANLLVGAGPAGEPRITGVLDLGDLVVGPRVAELAVAGAYVARNTGSPAHGLLDVAGGWLGHEPLSSAEAEALLPAAVARLAVNACVWAARTAGSRGDYARSRSAGAAATLDALAAVDPAWFGTELRRRGAG